MERVGPERKEGSEAIAPYGQEATLSLLTLWGYRPFSWFPIPRTQEWIIDLHFSYLSKNNIKWSDFTYSSV